MNSTKLGMFAAAALTVIAAQANANEHKEKAAGAAKAGKEVAKVGCMNSCADKDKNTAGCAGKVPHKDAAGKDLKTEEACTKDGGKWVK